MERLSLQGQVSTNVRVLLHRRGKSPRDLAGVLGMDEQGLVARLDGLVAWDAGDIERVAGALRVPWLLLMLHDEQEMLRQAGEGGA